jgi:membrane protease YdiL (CAAX protease family)
MRASLSVAAAVERAARLPMKRILAFLAAAAVCVFGYVFLLSLMRGSPYDLGSVAAAFILAIALGALNKTFFRSEGGSLAEIGIDIRLRRPGEFGLGFLAGCGVVTLWALTLWIITSLRWQPYDGFVPAGATSRIAFCFSNNAAEELAYRGYLLWALARRLGAGVAAISTAAFFALLHVQAGVPWPSAITVVFTSGVLFAVLLLRWRSLPAVVGFHVATNVAQELIGLRVTPLTVVRPVFARVNASEQIGVLVVMALLNLSIIWIVARKLPRAASNVPESPVPGSS